MYSREHGQAYERGMISRCVKATLQLDESFLDKQALKHYCTVIYGIIVQALCLSSYVNSAKDLQKKYFCLFKVWTHSNCLDLYDAPICLHNCGGPLIPVAGGQLKAAI